MTNKSGHFPSIKSYASAILTFLSIPNVICHIVNPYPKIPKRKRSSIKINFLSSFKAR